MQISLAEAVVLIIVDGRLKFGGYIPFSFEHRMLLLLQNKLTHK